MKKSVLFLLSLNFAFFSFPPYKAWFLAFFVLVPLFSLFKEMKSGVSVYAVGVLFFSFLLSYLAVGLIPYYGWKIYLPYVLVFGVFHGIKGLVFWFLEKNEKIKNTQKALIFASAAAILFYIQNLSVFIFPGEIYIVLANAPFLLESNKFFGTYFTVFALYFMSYLLFICLTKKGQRKKAAFALLLFILLWISMSTAALFFYGDNKDASSKNLSLLQGSTPVWAFREGLENPQSAERIKQKYLQMIDRVENADFIIIPEMAFPLEYQIVEKELREKSKNKQIPLIFGVSREENNLVYNAVAFIKSEKSYFYKKRNLVPLYEDRIYTRETLPLKPVGFEGIRWGTAICFENLYPSHFKTLRNKKADVFLVVSDDAGFKKTMIPLIHGYFSVFRAVENNISLIHAGQSGPSFIVDNHGEIKTQTGLFESTIFTGSFQLGGKLSLYSQIDDVWILVLILLLVSIIYFYKISTCKCFKIK